MIHCGESGTAVSPELVGHKASALIDLYHLARDCSFVVPEFCVLPAALLGEFHQLHGPAPRLSYPGFPSPGDVPEGTVDYFRPFTSFARDALDSCTARIPHPLILRTSLVLPPAAGGREDTGCGCNSTRLAEGADLTLSPLVPELLASFMKAYTTWSLDPMLQWSERTGGLIVMTAHPFKALGAAWMDGEQLVVEADGKYPPRRERYHCDPNGAATGAMTGRSLTEEDLKALALACQEIRHWYDDQGLVEVEFGFGLDDSQLYLVQARCWAGERSGPFHTIGRAQGRLRDLHDVARNTCSQLGQSDDVLVLPRESSAGLDCFTLVWSGTLTGSLLIEDTGAIAHGAGFRNHLARRLMERHPELFIGQLPSGWRPGPDGAGARLYSDGTHLSVELDGRTAA